MAVSWKMEAPEQAGSRHEPPIQRLEARNIHKQSHHEGRTGRSLEGRSTRLCTAQTQESRHLACSQLGALRKLASGHPRAACTSALVAPRRTGSTSIIGRTTSAFMALAYLKPAACG